MKFGISQKWSKMFLSCLRAVVTSQRSHSSKLTIMVQGLYPLEILLYLLSTYSLEKLSELKEKKMIISHTYSKVDPCKVTISFVQTVCQVQNKQEQQGIINYLNSKRKSRRIKTTEDQTVQCPKQKECESFCYEFKIIQGKVCRDCS